MWVKGWAASSPGMLGMAAWVPISMNTCSAVSTRVPPAFRLTSSVFGPTKRPEPMISSAPLVRKASRCLARLLSTMRRLRSTTAFMSVLTGPVSAPNCFPSRASQPILALQISFLLGRHAMLGQAPPTHLRSTATVRLPDFAISQARSLPPVPAPSTSASSCSGAAMRSLLFLRLRAISRGPVRGCHRASA